MKNYNVGSNNPMFGKHRPSSQAPNWRGGQYKDAHGYVLTHQPEHPKAWETGYVKRARLVLEQKLGRYLLDGHIPHHINGIKDDDRPKNLIEISDSEHRRLPRRIKAYA